MPDTIATEEILLSEDRAGVRTLTLNRPERYNALSGPLIAELQRALEAAEADPEARVIVIKGAGRGFSAGHDLEEVRGIEDEEERLILMTACSHLMQTVVHLKLPVIAQVHGVATAAGCQLVASCDLALCETGSRFGTPGVNIGLFCSTPMVALSRTVHRKHALKMLLTGELIPAEEAVRIGLVNEAVPAEELEARTRALAETIAGKSRHVIGLGKPAFAHQIDLPLGEAYGVSTRVMVENLRAADCREGIGAFLEKRKPAWRDA